MEFIFMGKPHVMSKNVYQKIVSKCCGTAKKAGAGYTFVNCKECGKKFHRWKANKVGRCCVCRAIAKKVRLLEGVFSVKDGYPKTTAIPTLAEMEDYYEHDLMTCLYCGNEFSMLWQHLRGAHDVTVDEYKLEFGLPFSKGLTGKKIHEQFVENGLTRCVDGIDPFFEYFKTHDRHDNSRYKRTSVGAPHSLGLQEKARATAVHMVNSPNHIMHRKDIVDAYCSKCGILIEDKEYTEMAVITHNCQIVCTGCEIPHTVSQQRWADKKGFDLKAFKKKTVKEWYARGKVPKKRNKK
jgi:hypothetical protein